jgi:hypothetical protein
MLAELPRTRRGDRRHLGYPREPSALAPRKGLEKGITATSRYESLIGDQYETSWVINPLLIAAERYASELDRDSE